MTVLVYSANVGGRDEIHVPVEQIGVDVEWYVVTDDLVVDVPPPWWWLKMSVVPDEHPNMVAKRVKTHPGTFEYAAPKQYDAMIWVDASMEITSPTFVAEAVSVLLSGMAPLAAFAHPRRDCVYDEAVASTGPEGLGRYEALPIDEQMAAYRAEGYPEHAGLWCGGAIAWENSPVARELAAAWYAECERWGFQDQLALPVVCWRAGYRPSTFPVPIIERHGRHGGLTNRWFTIHPHQPDTEYPAA